MLEQTLLMLFTTQRVRLSISHFLRNSFSCQELLRVWAWKLAFPPNYFPPLWQTGNWEPNHLLWALLQETEPSLCTLLCCGCSGFRASFSCRSTLGNDNIW